MRTHSDEILYLASRTYKDAITYAGEDHTPEDYKSLVIRLGSAVEIFLKDHIYAGTHNTQTFNQLINGLETMGVTKRAREFLHDLRNAYNAAKHEPTYQASIEPTIIILKNSETSLDEIAKLGLGNANQPATPKIIRRQLWFAAWDHYIGGDTEFSIFLPCSTDVDFPSDIEIIYLKMEDWEIVQAELSTVGNLCLGQNCVPKKFYDFWSNDDEFLAAGSFEGNLKEMIAVLSRHERVENILPDLKRENEPLGMLAAALFAAIDLAQLGNLPSTPPALAEAIIENAESHYAAPRTSRPLTKYAAVIAEFIGKFSKELLEQLSGPVWVGKVRYAELEAEHLFQIKEPPLMILRDGRLIAKLS